MVFGVMSDVKKLYNNLDGRLASGIDMIFTISPWIWCVVGMYCMGMISRNTIEHSILGDGDSDLVPYHMIVVFLACIYMSASLDRTGYFDYLSSKCMEGAADPQKIFYNTAALCGVLSIIISPDVTVMSVTPFLIAFCKSVKCKPLPFVLISLFSTSIYGLRSLASASTYAMAEAYGLSQWDYFLWFSMPHIVVLASTFWCTKLMIGNFENLKEDTRSEEEMGLMEGNERHQEEQEDVSTVERNLPLGNVFASIIVITTLVMTFGESIIPVWVSTVCGALAIAIKYLIDDSKRGEHEQSEFLLSLRDVKVSWAPYVFFCFVLIECIREQGGIAKIAAFLRCNDEIDEEQEPNPFRLLILVFTYTIGSIIFTGFVNKNPATIGFCRLLLDSKFTVTNRERWAMSLGVIFGLNMGIYLAPMGSMTVFAWMNVLKRKGINISFSDFLSTSFRCLLFPLGFGILILSWEAYFWKAPQIRVTEAPQAAPWSGWMIHKKLAIGMGDWTAGSY